MPKLQIYSVYGINIASDYTFQYPLITSETPADVVFTCTSVLPENIRFFDFSQENNVTVETPQGQRKVIVAQQDDDGGSYLLQFRDYILFWIKTDSITAYIRNLPDTTILEMLFIGPALALWRYSHGALGLHAASVSINDKAVLFSASNKSGKSSLAASCMQVGHALLADDYAALKFIDGKYYVQPGYPQMRMWDDQAAYFYEGNSSLTIMRETYPKRLVPVGQHGFGQFSRDAKPLHVIYVPQRSEPGDPNHDIIIEPIAKALAVTTLMRSGAVSYFRRWLPLHQHNLRLLSELVSHVPVHKISYPSGYDLLSSVRDAILEDVRNI